MRVWAAGLLAAALLFGGQAAADALAPQVRKANGELLGRTGFAYLTGVRRYAAAVLWARLDPINDKYYDAVPLAKKKFLMPSIRIIVALDPELQEAYYVGPFVLYEAGQAHEAVKLAEEGVRENPDSALLHASFAQLLLVEGRTADARREADITLTKRWLSEGDQYQLFSALEVIFRRTGAPEKEAFVRAERDRLRAKFEASGAMPAE